MSIIAGIIGVILIFIVLGDAFETVVFPRRVTRKLRLVRYFYRASWRLWFKTIHAVSSGKRLETLLSYYGPISLPLLLVMWAAFLIVGYALLYWALGNAIKTPEGTISFTTCLYFSGTAFFTLGLGDVVPMTTVSRILIVLEAGMGFAFLAIIISYLPALNQSFSRREVSISLLDARAGSPPTAAEILRRHMRHAGSDALTQLFHEWERWSAELLESHLSFPVLVYFRSQHDNQSWLSALTSILDACAFTMTSIEGECARQAQLTFAMARHAIVDLALVLHTPPREPLHDRLPSADLATMRSLLRSEGIKIRTSVQAKKQLVNLRHMYEPYVQSLSDRLHLSLPTWVPEPTVVDNWEIGTWEETADVKRAAQSKKHHVEHF